MQWVCHAVTLIITSYRNASKENAAAVKEAQAAQKKIDAAEASVKVVEDEIEELSAQEQGIGEQLR